MKKLFALVLTVLVVLAFASCGKDAGKSFDKMTAYEHYVAVNEKMKNAKSLEMEIDSTMAINMPSLGMNMDMDMRGSMQQVSRSETDKDMHMEMIMDMMGQSITTQVYFVDGMMYQNSAGTKTKQPLSLEELADSVALANGATSMEFAKEDILESKLEDTSNGKKLTFVTDPKKMSQFVEKLTGPTLASMAAGEDVALTLDISKLNYEMTFDREHNIQNMRVVMDMSMVMTESGMEMAMDISMDMAYVITGIDKISEIKLPADADSYEPV